MESRATTPARNAAIARLDQLDQNRKALLKQYPQVMGKIQRLEDDLIASIGVSPSIMASLIPNTFIQLTQAHS